jgi:cyclophilin family peptidyl-prolyl cis-trans isomerase
MEPYRGFPQFIEAAHLLQKARPKAHVVIAGDNRVAYGKQAPNGKTWKDLYMEKYPLDPARTLYMELDAGRVIIELAPRFAKAHFANLQALVANRWFDGLSINRVQDGFVTQWGDASERKPMPYAERKLAPEFERAWTKDVPFDALRDGDVYAPQVGFVDGFAAAGDRKQGRIWLAQCYGVIGVGRDAAEDSGNAAELYAVIGHAPRHLDRNLTVIGRVVQGMELLAALPRGTKALGFYETAAERLPIRSVRFAADVDQARRTGLARGRSGRRRLMSDGLIATGPALVAQPRTSAAPTLFEPGAL